MQDGMHTCIHNLIPCYSAWDLWEMTWIDCLVLSLQVYSCGYNFWVGDNGFLYSKEASVCNGNCYRLWECKKMNFSWLDLLIFVHILISMFILTSKQTKYWPTMNSQMTGCERKLVTGHNLFLYAVTSATRESQGSPPMYSAACLN
jgi:hypothetical protein